MLKRIRVEDVRLGMFIHGFAGSWLDHPFWRNRFLLDDPQDLARIRASAVREVWIDVAQGADVEPQAPVVAQADTDSEVPTVEVTPTAQRDVPPKTQAEELKRAARVLESARAAVVDMFQDARMGRAIDAHVARAVVDEIADSVTRNGGALINLARLKTADDYT
ncbi:MAG: DUF3391 domain-containing protein [Tepidimonas taiwanensis]|nr:DUF3391 domain-containing protein [Tepidimonas taiwanensis]